jgi:hypothetical protein
MTVRVGWLYDIGIQQAGLSRPQNANSLPRLPKRRESCNYDWQELRACPPDPTVPLAGPYPSRETVDLYADHQSGLHREAKLPWSSMI